MTKVMFVFSLAVSAITFIAACFGAHIYRWELLTWIAIAVSYTYLAYRWRQLSRGWETLYRIENELRLTQSMKGN